MRSRLVIVLALLVVIVAEAGARVIEPRLPAPIVWENQFTQTKADQIRGFGRGTVDVVYLGSSVVNADVAPELVAEETGRPATGYNAALPAYTPRVWSAWFHDIVGPDLCPSTVVVGVDIRQFSDNKPGAAGQLDAYLSSRGRRMQAGPSVFDSALAAMQRVSALVRIRDRLREPDKLLAWFTGIGDRGDWKRLPVGEHGRYLNFDDDRYTFDPERIEQLSSSTFRDFAMGGIETRSVRDIVETASRAGANVLLVEMPSMRADLAAALPDGAADLDAFSAILDEIGSEFDVPVIRFADLDDRADLFADEYHMNRAGVETIAGLLAAELDALPDPASVDCDAFRSAQPESISG